MFTHEDKRYSRPAEPATVTVKCNQVTTEITETVEALAQELAEHEDEVVVSVNRNSWRIATGLSPEWLVEASRATLGKIALDPASSPEANQRVRAETFFTRADDGLSKNWWGPLYLNPPGGQRGTTQRLWWEKLLKEWREARLDWSAIFVCSATTRSIADFTEAWEEMLDLPRCSPHEPIRFEFRPGAPCSRGTPGKIVCVSIDPNVVRRFKRSFSPYGRIE